MVNLNDFHISAKLSWIFPFYIVLNYSIMNPVFQAIRKVLVQNFHSEEEMDSQALLFKNLWLEAEAKLCSISYKARFDRMKVEMQKFKVNQTQGKDCFL